MLANDLNIPEFSTEDSQLLEGMLWGYSADPPSCTLWGDSVPAAGDGVEPPSPWSPLRRAIENGSSSPVPVPCISLLEDSPDLAAEKAAMISTYSHDMKRAEFDDYKKFLAMAKEKLADIMKHRDSHLWFYFDSCFWLFSFHPHWPLVTFSPQMMASCAGVAAAARLPLLDPLLTGLPSPCPQPLWHWTLTSPVKDRIGQSVLILKTLALQVTAKETAPFSSIVFHAAIHHIRRCWTSWTTRCCDKELGPDGDAAVASVLGFHQRPGVIALGPV